MSPPPAYVPPVFHPRWPLFTVYPLAACFFWVAYLRIIPALSRRLLPERYARFNRFNERCWRQNVLSMLHTCVAVVILVTVLATEWDSLFSHRLYPHGSTLLYVDISLSLGYFTFALPISAHMAFVLKAGFPYGSPIMSLHHVMVVLAQATFLLTQYPSFYMAASGALFEITNVFFVPHVLMIQLETAGRAPTVVGLLLFISYSLCRVLGCTVLCILALVDFAHFEPPEPLGACFRTYLLTYLLTCLLAYFYRAARAARCVITWVSPIFPKAKKSASLQARGPRRSSRSAASTG